MKKTVVVIGGGVAGMSVAHELAERSGAGVDFDIHVYERRQTTPGGKARTIPVPGSGVDGRTDLPGEHGFRFFPGFYKHLPDTMSRIPYRDGATVLDNLVVADRLEIARFDQAPIIVASRFPRGFDDLVVDLKAVFDSNTGLLPGEIEFFAKRIWQILTSCQDRRVAQYEKITWADFLEADSHSPAYRSLLVAGLSRSLLANDPFHASARTVGDTNIQLMLGVVEPGQAVDRLLNGPTSAVWLDPWFTHLKSSGVDYQFDAVTQAIRVEGGKVTGVEVIVGGVKAIVQGDAYVFALPVEKMAAVLKMSGDGQFQDPLKVDPALGQIITLAQNVGWMNGIQFFLRQDVSIVHGHTLYADSPWALTSISQAQFWNQEHLRKTGDGTVRGVLSVCISEWETAGILYGLAASACSRKQIADEVWAQLKRSLNVAGNTLLDDANLHSWFLDPDIIDLPGGGIHYTDAEPLFVNFIDTWAIRPTAATGISNMFLASDYLQTNTDVACMEAANEAARRAVNDLLTWSGSTAEPCTIWPLHEPLLLAPLRWHDKNRFDQGLPWDGGI